MRSFSLTKS